jgi:hypothetical protein
MRELLQYSRPQSMYDSEVHNYISEILKSGENFASEPDKLMSTFKRKFHDWLITSQLNSVPGLGTFKNRDIIVGVTQYLDDLHQTRKIVVLENEYRYHWRLLGDKLVIKEPEELVENDNLIISMPFPYYGDIHPQMDNIIKISNKRNVNVHIDACWYGCCRDINFNFLEPCIKSVGFSLSKSLGLGANRIGVRYSKDFTQGPISIMNQFNMNNQILVWMGTKFIDKFGPDFWQNKYGEAYKKICRDYNLTPTKAIHLAWDGNRPVGVRLLLRKLVE